MPNLHHDRHNLRPGSNAALVLPLLLFWAILSAAAIESPPRGYLSPSEPRIMKNQQQQQPHNDYGSVSVSSQKTTAERSSPDVLPSATTTTATPTTNFCVINLDRDTERWDSVVSELTSRGGVPHERIQRIRAVYGKDLTAEELESNTTWVARHFCTLGTIGCYLSHRSAWERTLEGGSPYQIVLEDDVLVAEDFPSRVAEILREIDEDCEETRNRNWDVIFLGALGCVHPSGRHGLNWIAACMSGGLRTPKRRLPGAPHCHLPRRPLGAHAYVLSKRGASKLLRNCWRVSGHVDVVAWGMPDLCVISVHPMLAHQNMGSVSTIGAVTKGLETRLPRLVVDEYTGIVLEWVYNAPVLSLGPVLLTMGRSVTYILGGYLLAGLLYGRYPWLVVVHTIIFGILFVLTKATTMRFGK